MLQLDVKVAWIEQGREILDDESLRRADREDKAIIVRCSDGVAAPHLTKAMGDHARESIVCGPANQ